MTGLETRGIHPKPGSRDELAKFLHVETSRMFRTELAIQLIWGNSWSGYLENGNPHGAPRPGPIAELKGILNTNKGERL